MIKKGKEVITTSQASMYLGGERVKQDEEGTQDGGGRVVSRGPTEFCSLGSSYLDICSIIIP